MYRREKIFENTWRIKGKLRQIIAAALVVTMLPFSSFTAIGTTEAYAKGLTKNAAGNTEENRAGGEIAEKQTGGMAGETEVLSDEGQVSANASGGVSMEAEASGWIRTHGGEETDAFVNGVLNGDIPCPDEDLTITENYVLQEDIVVNDLVLEGGKLDLKGHTLYIYGDMAQTGGVLEIGNGKVVICKDYDISGEGTFTMTGENGYLLVMGNFCMESLNEANGIYLGVMEVKGDFVQSAPGSPRNFYTNGMGSDKGFTLFLTGSVAQRLFMEKSGWDPECGYMSGIANLVIENESEEGVTLENAPWVLGKVTTNGNAVTGNLGIGNGTVFTEEYFDGGITILSNTGVEIRTPLAVGEGLTVKEKSHLSLYDRLEAAGDAEIKGSVHVYGNGLHVKGDISIENEGADISCGLDMTKDEAFVLAEGDFYQKISMPYHMTGGIIECQGNVTIDGPFGAEGKQRVVLSGTGEQRINLLNGASFQILELENRSSSGIVVDGSGAWKRLVSNGCKISVQEVVSETGYILEEDETVSADFVLKGGILDLNGHTLTVAGDFLHSGGTVTVGEGKLVIEGDYRFQSRSGEKTGGYSYGGSEGKLEMSGENGHILVEGDFYEYSGRYKAAELSAGCLELKGNFYQWDEAPDYGFYASGSNTVLISGDRKQTIHFQGDSEKFSYIQNLSITNVSSEGVVIEGAHKVYGKCESLRGSHIEGRVCKGGYDSEWGEFYNGDMLILDTLNLKNGYELGGDLYIERVLNVYEDLVVDGSIYLTGVPEYGTGGYLNLYDARLTVKGDVEAESDFSYAGIILKSGTSYAVIEGSYRIPKLKTTLNSQGGALEVWGDLTFQGTANYNAVLILKGSRKQTVSATNDSYFKTVLIRNDSTEGVCFNSVLSCGSLINESGCPVTYFGEEGMAGFTLTEDVEIEGNAVMTSGTMDLNGHTLTVKGNLIQMDGIMNIGGGKLIVEGGYYLGNPDTMWDENDGATSTGYLFMTKPGDYVQVDGDFYISWGKPYNYTDHYYSTNSLLTDGVLEVKGNFVQKEKADPYASVKKCSFPATGNHRVILSGEQGQTVWFAASSLDGSRIANLEITNNSGEGVAFKGEPCVTGKVDSGRGQHISGYLSLSSTDQLKDGYFAGGIVNSALMEINEDVEIGGDFKVLHHGGSSTKADVTVRNAFLSIGGNLVVEGILAMDNAQADVQGDARIVPKNQYDKFGIGMQNENDHLLINGDFIKETADSQFLSGTLEVKGDYRDKGEQVYGTGHRVLLSGTGLQTVDCASTFGILELQNHSAAGVYSEKTIKKNKLVLNGCRLTIGDGSGVYGFTLTQDYIAAGDFTLLDDTLDLNGHTLTVQGDLILQAGWVKVNGGKLIVEGNLRFQSRTLDRSEIPETDGNGKKYLYSQGEGHLLMEYEEDEVLIEGDLIVDAKEDISGDMAKGSIKLSGDLHQAGGNAFVFGGTMALRGQKKQSIYSETPITLYDLAIQNSSPEGAAFTENVFILGFVEDPGRKAAGSGSVVLKDIGRLKNGCFGGNVILEGNCIAEESIAIDGTLTIGKQGELHCGDKGIRAAVLIVEGKVYTDRASLVLEQALTVKDQGLFVMDDKSYVLVKGDASFIGTASHEGYLTDGTLEITGDFNSMGGGRSFVATGEHYTVFRRKNAPAGMNVKQTIKINNSQKIHFASLELTAGLSMGSGKEDGYEIPYGPEALADRVVYITPGAVIPEPLSSLAAEEVTVTSALLCFEGEWEEGVVKGFTVYRDGVRLGITTDFIYRDTGLLPGKTYTYTVYPYNLDKISAASSPACTVTTPWDDQAPSVPGMPEITERTGSSITLKWEKSRDNVAVTEYRLYRNEELIYTGPETTYKDSGLMENTVYTYCVKALDEAGNESEKSLPADGVVFMPRITAVFPKDYEIIGGDSVKLEVHFENGGGSKGNAVTIEYYDKAEKRWITITQPPLGQKTLDPKTLYAVYNWNIAGLSAEGDLDMKYKVTDREGNTTEQIVTYTLDRTAPAAPEKITAEDDGGTVAISWDISKSGDCTGYELYKVGSGTGDSGKIAYIEGRNASWYKDSDVEDDRTYRYYVRAVDAFGQKSPMSPVAEVYVKEDTNAPRVVEMTPAAGKVNKITKLIITGKDNRAVREFELFIRNTSEEEWKPLATAPAEDNKAVYEWDTTLYEEDTYYIKAVARDGHGNENTDLFMRRYVVDNTGIAKIRLLDATVGSTGVLLAWEDVTEEDFGWFLVEELVDDNWIEKGKVSDALGFKIENLVPDSTHTYRVTGADVLGNMGIPSDTMTVTTKEDTAPPVITAVNPISSYYNGNMLLSMSVKDNGGVAWGRFSYRFGNSGQREIATVSANGLLTETLSYNWDLSELPEGEVTVRFEAYDTAGYHNALYEEKEIENSYIIDRTAPEKVKGAAVTGEDGYIGLTWESVSDNDVESYEVQRALEDEGIFERVGVTNNTLYYHDGNVKQGVTYVYRILAIDIAGNRGEASDEVCGTVKPDEEAPVVTGISPGEAVVGANPTLKILTTDNAALKSVQVEFREEGESIWHEITALNAEGRVKYEAFTWNTAGLSEGTVYEVRAKATDEAGNEGDYTVKTYMLDLTPPAAPELSVQSGSFCVKTEFTENTEEDFRCYKIYRREYGDQEYTCIQATVQTEFTDVPPKTDTTYYYKVRAYDIYDNYSESEVKTCYANHVDTIAPVAQLPETMFGFTGMEAAFDGTLCSDNVRINRYEWDFGDGSGAFGSRPVHVYEKSGIYSVTLTVSDAAGNEAFATSTVQIMDKENNGVSILRILAEDGNAVSGAYVYIKTGNDKEDVLKLRSDKNGEVKVVGKSGIYEYAAFAPGYMPSEGTVRVSNYETLEENVTLKKGEVVTGNLTVERMELDELIEKGVDLSAPENYHTFRFKTELWFAASPLPSCYDVMVSDDLLIALGRDTDTGLGSAKINNGGGTLNLELLKPREEEMDEELSVGYVPTITYLQTTQSVSWLKDMYGVQLGIINNADSGYTITETSATINLPEGLSLAGVKSGQTQTTKLPDIGGQETASASWIVRGDETGTYDLSASFHGVLQPFEADLDAQFKAQMECEVEGGRGIVIYVSPEGAYYPGENYYIQFRIVNESGRNFYNFSTSLGEYKTSSHVTEVFIKDVETGRTIGIDRTEGMTYSSAAAAKSPTLPVVYDGDVINVGVFSPGQTIYGTYCAQMGKYSSDTTYFELVDSLVTAIEGENLGVEVRTIAIPSHISKYILYTDYRKRMREAKEAKEKAETCGDPIDVTTGAFLQELSTISLSGGSGLSFNLYYNSMLADYLGEAGYGFSHDYEQHVEEAGSSIILKMSPYSQTSFLHEEAANHMVYGVLKENTIIMEDRVFEEGTYLPTSPGMEGWTMEKDASGYRLTSKENAVYEFNRDGELVHIITGDGKGTAIAHGEGRMDITDDVTGESLHILYNGEGLICSVYDDFGRNVSLEYIDKELSAITGVTGGRSIYRYDGCHRMISAVNANGVEYVQNTYDGSGRVTVQKEAGKAGVSRLSYHDREEGGVEISILDQNGGATTVVTDGTGKKILEKAEDGAFTEYIYDKYGNLLNERDAYGNTVMYQYDENENLSASFDTAGNVSFFAYDERGNVTEVKTQTGDASLYTYDENNRLVRNVDPLGKVTRYVYDEDGNVIRQVSDGLGAEAYVYKGGKLTAHTDANGNTEGCTYDIYGNIASRTDASGNTTEFTYDASGNVLTAKTPEGITTAYTYDAIGQKIKETVTGPDGQTRTASYTYDAGGNILTQTDTAGNVTSYEYDGMSNITKITYPDGSSESFVYDRAGNMISQTDRTGLRTDYAYDLKRNVTAITTAGETTGFEYYPNGKVYKITKPDGETLSHYYDNNWNCIRMMDGAGNAVTYTYDAAGNRTSETDPLGNRTLYEYDIYGRCTQVTDPMGNKTSYAYDPKGNTVRITDALGNVTRMSYDAMDRPVKTERTAEAGTISVSYAYDEAGRVTAVTDEEGRTVRMIYDGLGQEKSVTDAKGNIVAENTYDGEGRLVKTSDGLGNTTEYRYDIMGNITRLTRNADGEGKAETGYSYDAAGRLISVTDGENGTASCTYDGKGNMASVTDPMGGTTAYTYDSMNRVTAVANAIGVKESYTYNAQGLLAESRNGSDEKTVYEYDAAGRIIKQKDSLGTISYTYDKNGNVLNVTDKNGTISRQYDALNRVTSVTDYKGDTISYSYDQLGNRVSITYPGGEKVRYAYYKDGNLKSVTDKDGNVTYYTYDENGRLTETERGDGSREKRTYDAAGQLLSVRDETAAGEVINEYAYDYDGRGNIIRINGMETGTGENVPGGAGQDSAADTGAQEGAAAQDGSAGADAGNGTGTEGTVNGIPCRISMTYDADNRLLTYNGQAVEYDACGNMTKGPLNGGMAEFTYDCRNRLVKVKEEDGRVTLYEYDAENIRTASVADGVRTEYTTDRESTYSQTLIKREYEKNVFGVYTEEISSTSYTYGLGLISERRDTGEEYYYHYNHLGSTMAVSNGSGEIIYRFVYSTYGELYDIKDGNGNSLGNIAASEGYTYAEMAHALGMEYLYNGQYGVSTDMDGLYYMRARYYDQSIKRFINRDVLSGDIGNSQSLNRFSYVQGNPVSLTDPFGLCPDGNSKIGNLVTRVFSDASGILNTMTEKPTVSLKDIGRAGLGLFGIGGDPVTSIKQLCAYAVAAELDWSDIGHTALGLVGIVWDGADLINAAWYCHEENYEMAAVSMLCALPFVGTLVGGSAGMALKVIGKGFTLGFATEGAFESISRAVDAYKNGTLSWWNALDVGFNTLGFGLAAGGFKGTFGDALAGKTEPGILNQAISWGRNKFNFGNTGSSSSGYYYHVTTEEYARQIIESGELRSGRWEARVFAWRKQPTRRQASVAGLGENAQTVIRFKTNASFSEDIGNVDTKILKGLVVQTTDGQRLPISITDVEIVGFK